jgi:hypothetical protein
MESGSSKAVRPAVVITVLWSNVIASLLISATPSQEIVRVFSSINLSVASEWFPEAAARSPLRRDVRGKQNHSCATEIWNGNEVVPFSAMPGWE